MTVLFGLVTGLVAGILSGLLGIGGGIILVPMMVFGLGLTQHIAQGISLLVIIPTAIAGAWQFHKQQLINYKVAVYLAIGSILGALLSSSYVQFIPAANLKKIFGVFVIFMGIRMIIRTRKTSQQIESNK